MEVTTREQLPQDWAMTQNNLAIALSAQAARTQGAKDAAELLAEAVTAYRSALEVFTREQLPHHWAETQSNLAIALRNQAARTEGAKGAELLAQAVIAYRNALEVTTREQLPQDWAMTQNNLAIALSAQAARTQGAKDAAELIVLILLLAASVKPVGRRKFKGHCQRTVILNAEGFAGVADVQSQILLTPAVRKSAASIRNSRE